MNDRHEFIYTRDLAMSALNKIGATQKEVNDFSDSWKTLPLQDNYIWSFSFNPESETLWNVYNGVNKGVSMAYSGASIMHALNNHLNPGIKSTDQIDFGNAFIAGLKVDYSEEFQKSTIKSIIIEWLYAYRAIEHNSKEAEEILMISAQALFFYALIFKNKYLSTEQEVRFLVIKKNLDNKIHADGKRDNKPYILCPIEPSNMLKSVTIQTNSTHSKNEVQNILDTSGFHCVKIYNSLMPY
ncbi:DUF2971 domain-containing protein [Loigolactobacillus jiayinensis]|uniref:DUF2971 domain-containing protein n=1 Tax=Loigolactobacillus jiayinensis TaxID=2486016 RepID=A0ABW1RH19_9LACO|nr:DUF2971 domain-containing protein [Loigolactobacillus jiayinensis]